MPLCTGTRIIPPPLCFQHLTLETGRSVARALLSPNAHRRDTVEKGVG